jgi:tRNA (guanine10-N2)-methyltransferase
VRSTCITLDSANDASKPDYIPPFRPYELVHLTLDLIRLARYLLVPKGRLVFFLPTVTEEYSDIDIPVVEGMTELKMGDGSVQDFGKWGRRVSTKRVVCITQADWCS